MNYVYDVLLNFQDYAYEFYEWNIDDEITHVRKVPMVRISTEQLEKLRDTLLPKLMNGEIDLENIEI